MKTIKAFPLFLFRCCFCGLWATAEKKKTYSYKNKKKLKKKSKREKKKNQTNYKNYAETEEGGAQVGGVDGQGRGDI